MRLALPLLLTVGSFAVGVLVACGGGDGVTATKITTPDASALVDSGSGGPTDAAATTTDAGTDAGVTSIGCAGQSYLLCDDFESIAAGSPPDTSLWKVNAATGAKATVDRTHVAHGNNAVHLSMPKGATNVTLNETKTFPPPAGTDTLFGRAYFYVPAGTVFPTAHTNFFEGDGKVGNVAGNYRYGLGGGKFFANYNPGDPGKTSKTAPAVGTWTCLEWEFAGDTNEMHFWVDETELTDVAIPSTGVNGNVWTAPKFDSLYVGWITYESQQTVFDVWYDDIAIDVKKIGCH